MNEEENIEIIPELPDYLKNNEIEDNTIVEVNIQPVSIPDATPVPIVNKFNITENTTSLAMVRKSDNLVETFIRLDIEPGWEPPDGYIIVPDDQLPEEWEKYKQKPSVPSTVTATQIRLWLVTHNINLQQIDNIINNIPDPILKATVSVQWEYAPYVERNHPMIETLGAFLGLSKEDIDNAFIEASQIG